MNARILTILALPFLFLACNQGHNNTATVSSHNQLIAVIHPTEGNDARGTITFTRENDGVRVQGNIIGLEANSRHGFHIHEYGDCSAADALSAGGHYSPHDMPHGAPTDDQRHVGDMGNLESNENGEASINYVDPMMELGGQYSILGRGVVVHADEDDLQTQPTGDAGGRIGCGVIGVAQQ